MNDCERHEMLVSAWMDDELDRREQLALVDHLVGCGTCRAFYARARALDAVVAGECFAGTAPVAIWQRIEREAGSGRRVVPPVPGWAWRAAAAVVLAVGLGVVMVQQPFTPSAPPREVEVRIGEDRGRMSDRRFVELTKEVLRADPRYHAALHRVMEQVLGDLETGGEATFDDFAPRREESEGSALHAERSGPA